MLTSNSPLGGPFFQAGIEDLDRGLASSRSPGARGAFPPHDAQVTAAGASVLETADSSLVWRLPYVAVWVFLMSLGASAAALLFRARVAELISRWTL